MKEFEVVLQEYKKIRNEHKIKNLRWVILAVIVAGGIGFVVFRTLCDVGKNTALNTFGRYVSVIVAVIFTVILAFYDEKMKGKRKEPEDEITCEFSKWLENNNCKSTETIEYYSYLVDKRFKKLGLSTWTEVCISLSSIFIMPTIINIVTSESENTIGIDKMTLLSFTLAIGILVLVLWGILMFIKSCYFMKRKLAMQMQEDLMLIRARMTDKNQNDNPNTKSEADNIDKTNSM